MTKPLIQTPRVQRKTIAKNEKHTYLITKVKMPKLKKKAQEGR